MVIVTVRSIVVNVLSECVQTSASLMKRRVKDTDAMNLGVVIVLPLVEESVNFIRFL